MLYQRLMDLIEQHGEEISQDIIREVRRRPDMEHYARLDDEILFDRISRVISNVYRRLGDWLSENKPKDVIFAYYGELGVVRNAEGIPLEEVVALVMLIKRRLWDYLVEHKLLDSAYGHQQLIELNSHMSLFFDRIVVAVVSGYGRQPTRTTRKRTVGLGRRS